MAETADNRLKRMRMRSWRRGLREMDLILGPFADTRLAALPETDLDRFEALLDENDQDLIRWMLGQDAPPAHLSDLVAVISAAARARFVPPVA